MSTFGNSFVQAFNPAFRQSLAAASEAQQMKMRQALEEQQRKTERERSIIEQVAMYGGQPIRNADGSLNEIATLARIQPLKNALEVKQATERQGAMYDQSVRQRANELGVADQSADLPRRVAMAEKDAKLKQAAEESKARAEATAPFEQQYAQGDNYALNGKPLGRAVRNLRTGQFGFMGADGNLAPIPEGAEPITPTAMQKNVPTFSEFRKVKQDLTDSERSLRQIDQYANSVGGLQQGLAGLADKFTAGIKTLMGSGKLSKAELDRRLAEGNLQGLLGGNRTAVVGGGVMTEQDAQRIIDYLGGDVGAWQNKEQVMQALSQLYRDRYAQYRNDIKFYNASVEDYYGSKGYEKQPVTDFNSLFGKPVVNGSLPDAAPAPSAAPAPAANDLRARAMAELEARRKGKR